MPVDIYVWEHSHMTSDVLGPFLTYLPTLIRYHQMWLDLPTYSKILCQILKLIDVHNMDLILLLRDHPKTMSSYFSNFMTPSVPLLPQIAYF